MAPRLLGALLAASFIPAAVRAVPFRLASYFASNMVLQCEQPTAVWGWGTPGQSVYFSLFAPSTNVSDTATATADSTGLFVGTLPPGPCGPVVYTLTVSTAPISERCNTYAYSCDGASITLANVVRGQALLCSGQSNMQASRLLPLFSCRASCAAAPQTLLPCPLPPSHATLPPLAPL
jgi:hypothetical protein